MKTSFLAKYLDSTMSLEDLKKYIDEPVSFIRGSSKETGASIPIEIESDLSGYVVLADQVKKICQDFINRKLDEVELNYLTTVIELSESFSFESELIEDAVSILSDSTSENPLTNEVVMGVIRGLS